MVAPRSFVADASDWFQVAEIEPGLHLVAEPGHVFSWLIAGSERSVLLDTGLGLADIAAAIAPVAAAPTVVVNSHVHFDHVGGNQLFEHTEMHALGPEWIEAGTRDEYLRRYHELAEDMATSWDRLRDAGPRRMVPGRARRDDATVAAPGNRRARLANRPSASDPPAGRRGHARPR